MSSGKHVTVADLEAVRQPLREIMHHRERKGATPLPAKVIDVTEDAAGVQTNRRATNLKTVDMKAYQQIVEAELKRHFDTNPTLQKIRAGEAGVGSRHSGACLAGPDPEPKREPRRA